jgi:hypothetical protein
VKWNQSTGASGSKALALKKAEYGTTSLWSGTDGTGTRLIPLSPTVTIPAGGNSSTFTFTFDANYDFPVGLTSIKFTVSSPSCENFSITRTQ